MVPGAIGSQTNGSVIRPAAFCGVVGFKPTHGLIPRSGALLLSRALDHVGVFARTVEDAALLAETMAASTRRTPTRGRSRARRLPPWPPASRRCRRASPSCARRPGSTPSRRQRAAFAELVGRARRGGERGRARRRASSAPSSCTASSWRSRWRTISIATTRRARDKLSPVLRQLIERGRAYPAIDYTRAVAGIGPLNAALDADLRRVRRDPHARRARRGAARPRQHRQPGVLHHLDLPRHAGRDAAAAAGRARHAARRAARRPPRQRCAALAHGALACQNPRERRTRRGRTPRATGATKRTRARQEEDCVMTNLVTGIIGIAAVMHLSRHPAVVDQGLAADHHRGGDAPAVDHRLRADAAHRQQRWRQELARPHADLASLDRYRGRSAHRRAARSPRRSWSRACLARIDELEPQIGAWTFLDREHALAQARAADAARRAGKGVGPLNGLPVGVKDIIDTADMPTEHGCPVFKGRRPARGCGVRHGAAPRRRGHPRQDRDDGAGSPQSRGHAQSPQRRAYARRLLLGLGGGGRLRHGAGGARHADRGLRHPPVRLLRRLRVQADVRDDPPHRRADARALARHGRRHGPVGGGRRPPRRRAAGLRRGRSRRAWRRAARACSPPPPRTGRWRRCSRS